MTEHRQDPLTRLAEAISDGTPVDWAREKSGDPSVRPVLGDLAVLERVRDVHRLTPESATASSRTLTTSGTPTINGACSPGKPLFTWGTLRILEKVGEGGWAEVYRAFDPALETEVALKLLKPDLAADANSLEHFIAEGRRLARVRHHNVLVVHGADRHDGRAGIWSEFLHGETLEQVLRRTGPMSAQEATNYGLHICRALSAVHAHDLVHRDVKASNVMREEGGRIVLMDFGSVAEAPRTGTLETTSHLYGTPVTMAPEQLRGGLAGAATDIYGLGALLYYLVTGHYPVEAKSLAELIGRHERKESVPLRDRRPDLPLEFVRVVERALAPDPAERFASAGAMERALAGAMAPVPAPQPEPVPLVRWGLVLAGATALAVVVALGAWRIFFDDHRPPAPVPHRVALHATASLQRVAGTKEEPLSPGSAIGPADSLCMKFTADEPMHVYVLNRDRVGNVFVIFPIPGRGLQNPIEAHRTYRLPGDSLVWNPAAGGGRESIVTIGAREPLRQVDSVLAEVPQELRGRPVQVGLIGRVGLVDHEMPVLTRGISGVSPHQPKGKPSPTAQQWFDDLIGNLSARSVERGDVWIWETVLENPPPRK